MTDAFEAAKLSNAPRLRSAWFGSRLRLGIALVSVLGCLLVPETRSQDVISIQAGMILHVEGETFLDNKAFKLVPGKFPYLEPSHHLRTENGRAEILLAAGSFLRIGKGSEVEMVEAGLLSGTARLVKGRLLIQVEFVVDKDSVVSVRVGDGELHFSKKGSYRIDAPPGEPPTIRVNKGKARFVLGAEEYLLKSKRALTLDAAAEPWKMAKAERARSDDLSEWNHQRNSRLREARAAAKRRLREKLRKEGWREPTDGGPQEWACSADPRYCVPN